MTYVMSDIHGEYEKYVAMLEKINFKHSDTLYILGDVVDRGKRPVDVLLDMMSRDNVFPLMGNHDYIAEKMLKKLSVEITEENYATHLDNETMEEIIMWQSDGGDTTMKQFQKLSWEDREFVIDYFEEFLPYETVSVGNRDFLLVHAGLGNFDENKSLDDYSIEELIFMRPDYSKSYSRRENLFIVMGHTPTALISGKAEIYKSHNNICIDCGACFDRGRLACLCLDDMKEYYI